jgi:hypothetical protein
MQPTLGAAIEKVVSEPSLFGRSLVEVSLPIALARALQSSAALARLAG